MFAETNERHRIFSRTEIRVTKHFRGQILGWPFFCGQKLISITNLFEDIILRHNGVLQRRRCFLGFRTQFCATRCLVRCWSATAEEEARLLSTIEDHRSHPSTGFTSRVCQKSSRGSLRRDLAAVARGRVALWDRSLSDFC